MSKLKSINPFTGEVINEIEEISDGEVRHILPASSVAFQQWRTSSFGDRSRLIRNVASVLRNNSGKYSAVITSEMGKPLAESRAEVEKCAWACEYYATNAETFLAPETIISDAGSSYVIYEPLGPILGIMPWNFPFWQVFRFAVPAVMAGNTALLKHASNVQMCAGSIEEIFRTAGFPEYVFSNLALGSSRTENIIRDDVIRAVSLTGSEDAGRKVAAIAGSVLKKCVLELGGSNAFIVLADADPAKASATGIKARFQNAGQSCIAAKRFIVERKISDSFLGSFIEGVRKLKPGDPLNEDTEIGPLCNKAQAEVVEDQVKRSVGMGARIIVGGHRNNAFFEPTVVADVRPGMPLFDEEVFGPVAPVTIAEDADEAVAIAKNTKYGLGTSLFTRDMSLAEKLAGQFADGAVFINGLVKSDPRLPFGGTGQSGYGRELSHHGIKEFVNIKTVWIA